MKCFPLFLLCFFVALGLRAQTIIPKVGLAVTYNTEGVDSYNTKPGVGFVAGLGYVLRVTDRFSFQPEMYYVQKAFNFDYGSTTINNPGSNPTTTTLSRSDKYRISYLEVPVLLKYKLMQNKMYVIFGPYLSFGLGGSHSFEQTINYPSSAPVHTSGSGDVFFGSAASGNQSNAYFNRKVDFGFQPGVGWVVFKKVQIEARAALGMIDLLRIRNSKNLSLMITASIPISLSKLD